MNSDQTTEVTGEIRPGYSMALKCAAVILLVLTVIGAVLCAVDVAVSARMGIYFDSRENVLGNVMEDVAYTYVSDLRSYYAYNAGVGAINNPNIRYEMLDLDGNIIVGNYSGEAHEYMFELNIYEPYMEAYSKTAYSANIYILSTSGNDRAGIAASLAGFVYDVRYVAIFAAVLCVIASVILAVFLCCAAGRNKYQVGVHERLVDKIPFDIFTAAYVLLFVMEAVLLNDISYSGDMGVMILLTVFVAIDIPLLILFMMSFAVRCKKGTVIRKSYIYIACRFVCRTLCRAFCFAGRLIRDAVKALPFIWKTAVALVLISLAEFILILVCGGDRGALLIVWFIEKLVLVPCILVAVLMMRRLLEGGEKLAGGDLDYHIDISRMVLDFKKHGENLNSISAGMSKAVDERMKSERMEAALITNVSHDIKTPLTSIINYVDIMKNSSPSEEQMREYIDILDRQSKRLKKLTEDIVETSKASSGALKVDLEKCEIGVMLSQAAGEYASRFEENQLEAVLDIPEESISVMADGRHMWRIFDNLLGNICKYSLPGTRVYMRLCRDGRMATVSFSNISKNKLNITPDELSERFVRGDESRSTEGSGLGLAIAKSLAKLQKVGFNISIDGDLFKVILTFEEIC